MSNPFDKFDEPSGNPFDKFDAPPAKPKTTLRQDAIQMAKDAPAGLIRGAGSIGNTLISAAQLPGLAKLPGVLGVVPKLANMLDRDTDRGAAMDAALRDMGADTDSWTFRGAKLGGEIAGTAGAGGVLGRGVLAAAPVLARIGVSAPAVANVASALTTSGMRAGTATGVGGMALRSLTGAAAGGAGTALIAPEHAGTGALVGGALPPVIAGMGRVGRAIGSKLAGPAATPEMQAAVQAARDAGYVMPPTQAKPTLGNRLAEGFAGKLTTAQNASARNQPVTNELARKAIGAADLSEAGIAQVRQQANKAYDELGQFGSFRADQKFQKALDAAGASTKEMRENFPGLVNSQIDNVVASLRTRGEFSAQSTIEAMKQFRANAAANKASLDPAAKAMGKAETKIAAALEDMVDRNLQEAGQPALLDAFRSARQTLAKTHDVEKALNKVTGNVDGNKLAAMLQKGKPITGELRTIAEFAARFPKANQTVERMGSLPGWSPLDFAALGSMSAATANPAMMAGVIARPAARSFVLSNPVQNRLATGSGPSLMRPGANQLLHRTVPPLLSDQ